ncbi:sensor histidine kinase [Corynebacterium sp.]|uniref:sensor histidine kinase n=1 Tax=Corynebacterium sp. TaxID=1720 RepID=UPI0026E012AA|nr:histidine kinase [Corynebacterium sp.]MDO5512674.1 histidine kinase [Corynebacterium sp.]
MDRRLLSFFFGVALLLFLGAVLAEHRPVPQQVLGGVTGLVLLAAWCLWLWRPGPATAMSFAVVGYCSFLIANSPTSIGLQWMTIIVLLLALGDRAALVYGAVVIATTGGIHLVVGSAWPHVLGETANAVLLVAAGLAVAGLIRGRQRALDELQEANERLRASLRDSRELALSQERERIAATLHDGLGHRLTTIGLSLDYSERMIDRDPERARAEVRRAREATTESLDVMRSTVRAMRPVELVDDDLGATLEHFAASFDTTGLQVSVDTALETEPDEPRAQLILRVVQEALTNVVRHADADRVRITLRDRSVSVADNGRGNNAAPDFGLRGLQEAAASLGGTLTIDPHGGIDHGALLTLTLPEEP